MEVRTEKSLEERKVEALEQIAAKLGTVCGELTLIREAVTPPKKAYLSNK